MPTLMHSYYFYSALLAVKLMAFIPLSLMLCNPDKIQRANVSDLKHLTPFWIVAGLYMTTGPNVALAVNLLRTYTLARFVAALGYIQPIPRNANEAAFFVSFLVTAYMGACVVAEYRDCL